MRFNYRKKQTLKEKYELKKPKSKQTRNSIFFSGVKNTDILPPTHKYSVTAAHTIKIKRLIPTNFEASGINAIAHIFCRVNKATVRNKFKSVCRTKD